MDVFIFLCVIALGVWFWLDGFRSREFATKRCQVFCMENSVQMLDQSIHLKKMFPARKNGRLALRRFYAFEFSINGADRYHGVAVEFKNNIEYLSLLHPDGEIIQGRLH
ncbi:MAG: DUF3301 domain-containing protein [Pseudomonadota bacterium]